MHEHGCPAGAGGGWGAYATCCCAMLIQKRLAEAIEEQNRLKREELNNAEATAQTPR